MKNTKYEIRNTKQFKNNNKNSNFFGFKIFNLFRISRLGFGVSDKRGVAALLTVVIVGAAVLIMAYVASILGLGELEMGYDAQKGGEAFAVVDGCAEEALRHLRIDQNYSGETLSLGVGSCIIYVTSDGNDRTISIIGTVGNYNKELEMEITLSGDNGDVISVGSWSEG